MPTSELTLFSENITYARDLIATASIISAQTTAAVRTDDLLRSALMQAVSALDHFVHEEVRARMLLTMQGVHPKALGFDRFRVSLGSVETALRVQGQGWLEAEIREQHGYLAFQHPDKIADAFRLVTDVKLWAAVAVYAGDQPDAIKRRLKLIVDRRNKIVHEADMDPTPPRTRYPIDEVMVSESVDFIENLVFAIDAVT